MGRIYDATWGRVFSAIYDPLLKGTEEAGLRERRRETLAAAQGRTIDIGAGTGANLGLFPTEAEVVMAEPDPHMTKRLRRKLAEAGSDVELVEAAAEDLPFEDSSFDTAVFTLVLCTVPDPRCRPRRGGASAEARWPAALRRARASRGSRHRPLAGPSGDSLARLRATAAAATATPSPTIEASPLTLELRRARRAAQVAADHQTAGLGQSDACLAMTTDRLDH